MKRQLFPALLVGLSMCQLLVPTTSQATDSLDAYAGLVSDYIFRGISQTENRAAIQAGAEYRHSIGMYTGAFISNVNTDPYQAPADEGSRAELDVYAGFGQEVASWGFGWDVGLIAYRYNQNQDNVDEVYVSGSFDPWKDNLSVVAKVSYDWDNKNLIVEAKATFDVGRGFDIVLSPGYVRFDDKLAEDYGFVTLGAGTSFEIKNIIETLDVAINYTTTDKDEEPDNNRNLVRDSWWLSVVAHF